MLIFLSENFEKKLHEKWLKFNFFNFALLIQLIKKQGRIRIRIQIEKRSEWDPAKRSESATLLGGICLMQKADWDTLANLFPQMDNLLYKYKTFEFHGLFYQIEEDKNKFFTNINNFVKYIN